MSNPLADLDVVIVGLSTTRRRRPMGTRMFPYSVRNRRKRIE
jgi:hypothetical protein